MRGRPAEDRPPAATAVRRPPATAVTAVRPPPALAATAVRRTTGTGGSVSADAGADRGAPPPDAGKDAGVDRGTDGVTPGCPIDCSHLPHVRPDVLVSCVKGKCAVLERPLRARVRQLQRQRRHRLRNRHFDRQQLRELLLQMRRAPDLSSAEQRRLSVRESVQRSVSRRVRRLLCRSEDRPQQLRDLREHVLPAQRQRRLPERHVRLRGV